MSFLEGRKSSGRKAARSSRLNDSFLGEPSFVSSSSASSGDGILAPAPQTASRAEVAEMLRRWSQDEMGFKPQGRFLKDPLPSAAQMQRLCRGDLVEVWKWIATHCKNADEVRELRLNQMLWKAGDDSQQERERRQLLERKRELQAKLEAINEEDKRVSADAEAIKREWATMRREREAKRQQRRDALIEECINEAAAMKERHFAAVLREYTRRIRELTRDIEGRLRGEDEIQFGGKLLQAQQTEKASVQEVRGALQMAAITVKECIEIFSTNTTASSMSSQPSVQSVASASHQILSKLLRDEEMIKSVSTLEVTPSSFLEALESISQEAVKEFQQFVEQSQCAGKSKQQEEKENCAENDGDNPLVQRLQGLQEVLQKERKRHVARFEETQAMLNEAHKLELQAMDLLEQHRRKQNLSADEEDSMQQGLEIDLSLSAEKAALSTLLSEIKKLNIVVDERKSVMDRLEKRRQKMERFDSDMRMRKERLFSMMMGIEKDVGRIIACQLRQRTFLDSDVIPLEYPMAALPSSYGASSESELRSFCAVSVHDLRRARRPTLLFELDERKSREVQSALCNLPPELRIISFDEIVPSLAKQTLELEERRKALDRRLEALSAANHKHVVLKLFDGSLVKALLEGVAQLQLPSTSTAVKKALAATEDCSEVRQLISDWRDLPAIYAVSQRRVGGKSMKEWVDEYAALSHRFQQRRYDQM